MWRGDIIGRDASSELPAAGSISASAANGEAGNREGGQEPKEAFPGPMAVAMARPTGGHGQVQGREAISTAVSERERRLYLHLHDLALPSCTAFAKPFLSYLQTLPSRVPSLELFLARQVCLHSQSIASVSASTLRQCCRYLSVVHVS